MSISVASADGSSAVFSGASRERRPEFPRKGTVADEAHVSAEQPAPETDAWVSFANGNPRRAERVETAAAQGPQAPDGPDSGQARPALVTAFRKLVSRTSSCSTPNAARSQRFGKGLRLRLRRDFLRVQRKGRRRHTAHFVLVTSSQPSTGQPRIGFSVSRRVGNAVLRNRVRRRLREFFRLNRSELPEGCDTVVIAKPGAAKLSYGELVDELRGRL